MEARTFVWVAIFRSSSSMSTTGQAVAYTSCLNASLNVHACFPGLIHEGCMGLHKSFADPTPILNRVSLSTTPRHLRRPEIPRENEGSDQSAEQDADDNVPVVVHSQQHDEVRDAKLQHMQYRTNGLLQQRQSDWGWTFYAGQEASCTSGFELAAARRAFRRVRRCGVLVVVRAIDFVG